MLIVYLFIFILACFVLFLAYTANTYLLYSVFLNLVAAGLDSAHTQSNNSYKNNNQKKKKNNHRTSPVQYHHVGRRKRAGGH